MAHKSKLKSALEAYQGKNARLEHQKRLQKKAAAKAKKKKSRDGLVDGVDGEEKNGDDGAVEAGQKSGRENRVDEGEKSNGVGQTEGEGTEEVSAGEDEDEDEGSGVEGGGIDIARLDDSESESELEGLRNGQDDDGDEFDGLESDDDGKEVGDDEQDEEDEEEEDIPLSELSSLSSAAKEDIIPHQRLQINNTSALLTSLKSISLPLSKLPFSEHQSITSTSPTEIPDINDDLNRELAFYKQSLEAVQTARKLLKAEGLPFSRPTDYFAEMVKSDEHMGRIKEKLIDEASRKKAAAEARKLRDLKKFGKQVQVAKLQERDKEKRETLNRIQSLKRKRQQGDLPTTTNEEEGDNDDPFSNVTVEDNNNNRQQSKRFKANSSSHKSKVKTRDKRDAKFGFGGKKRHAKSGDAISSGDLSSFSNARVKGRGSTGSKKGKGGGGGAGGAGKEKGKRLGKSRRVANKR